MVQQPCTIEALKFRTEFLRVDWSRTGALFCYEVERESGFVRHNN